MREVMAIQVAAWSPWGRPPAVAGSAPIYGTSPYYVFVVGPVQSVHALHRNPGRPDPSSPSIGTPLTSTLLDVDLEKGLVSWNWSQMFAIKQKLVTLEK